MKLYLAGPMEHKTEIAGLADRLEQHGHTVTSHWLRMPETVEDELRATHADFVRWSVRDLAEIREADALVMVTVYGAGTPGGGRHVETGYAMGLGKPVVVYGPTANLFHRLCEFAGDEGSLYWVLGRIEESGLIASKGTVNEGGLF